MLIQTTKAFCHFKNFIWSYYSNYFSSVLNNQKQTFMKKESAEKQMIFVKLKWNCLVQKRKQRPFEICCLKQHRGKKKAQKDAQIIADSHQGISKSVILKHFP